jgi:hypothetical protein
MILQPSYFERIRAAAAGRWRQLEADPDLAGPWHQLFKQVQSPRHVLSELLQNADDAGATETCAQIVDRQFVFTHNGEDFTEEHFASLCRFGYSNKRALHTIGFRGIGFKSTFSLGDAVELYTPTLSVAFHRKRFTEPKWVGSKRNVTDLTQIRVRIDDERREEGVQRNLQEWLRSPLSLLFFRHIRNIRIGDREVHWKSLGRGPVPETEWMALDGSADAPVLVARSQAEEFPNDALAEIKQERLLSVEEGTSFPPSRIEIVLGASGQLYVVLPTGVDTDLPFACNAPFIQDSARLKIKDPEISPTNRWLLERTGKLAAAVMSQWIGDKSISVEERSHAYGLLPDVDRDDSSLEGTCATTVEEAFGGTILDRPFLLTNAGDLKPSKQSVIVPDELLDVWSGDQVVTFLDEGNRPALSRHVSQANRHKLIHWDAIEQIEKSHVLRALRDKHLPKPESWRRLLKLWAYVAPEITARFIPLIKTWFAILPVQGKDVLYSAHEVVRLGEKKLLQSEADWEFLASHLLVLNQNWPRFLAEQRRAVEDQSDQTLEKEVAAAFAVFHAIGLEGTSDVSVVIEQVAKEFFGQKTFKLADCVQLAQIAAKLGATAGSSFRFVTRDRVLRPAGVVYDADGTLEALLPENWCPTHLLHPDYQGFVSCTAEEWARWISSRRSGLLEFPPLIEKRTNFWSRAKVEAELRRRGFNGLIYNPYQSSSFSVEDWDFEDVLWQNWAEIAGHDPGLWCRAVERIFAQSDSFWSHAKGAKVSQIARNGSTREIVDELVPATWILRLRDLPCLPDTRGFYHKPSELLRRTPETEPFMDVEPFIHGRLDREATRPLLELLGVRDTPASPGRLLDCLRTLSRAEKPPVHEVEKWYRRLDQMIETCSTDDFADIKKAFHEEKIIFSEKANWTNVLGVYLSSDEEDVPDAEIVRDSVRDLMLWRKIGVAERPTSELAIQWLKGLPSGQVLSQNDVRRVRALLARYAARIWDETGHWLNLAAEWVPVSAIGYALTMQSLVPWSHLHEWVKQKTADLQRCPVETTEQYPFSGIPLLAGHVENRFHRNPKLSGRPERRPWLNVLGAGLRRIELENDAETERIRALALVLAETTWQTSPGLEIIPYIDGVPAGTPKRAEAIWLGNVLYVEDRGLAKVARAISQELGRVFGRQEITDAIKLCFDRSPEFVSEYLEENFRLSPIEAAQPSADEKKANESAATTSSTGSPTSPIPSPDVDNKLDDLHGELVEVNKDEREAAPEINLNGSEEDDTSFEDREPQPVRERHEPKVAKPSIMECFARKHGFRKDHDNRFFHSDGSWIEKKPDDARFWERRTGKGELVRYYWAKDHCLEQQPLQIEADIWGLIEKFPELYTLVLLDMQDAPIELVGVRLRSMRESGEITLHPATYRLVYDHGKE